MVHEFTIPGKPIAKKRPRFARRGKFVSTYNCQETEEGRFLFELHKQIGHDIGIIKGPVEISMVFSFERPQGHFSAKGGLKPSAPKYHTKKPDIDNLTKFVLDCMNGCILNDDAQVVATTCSKVFGPNLTQIRVVEL